MLEARSQRVALRAAGRAPCDRVNEFPTNFLSRMLYKSRPLDAILNQRGRKLTTLAKSSLGIRLFKSLRAFGWKLFYPIIGLFDLP